MALLSSLLISIGSFQNSYEGIFNTFTKSTADSFVSLGTGTEWRDGDDAAMRHPFLQMIGICCFMMTQAESYVG